MLIVCLLGAACNLFIAAPYFFPFPSGINFPYSFQFNPASIIRAVEPLRASLRLKGNLVLAEECKEVHVFLSMRVLGSPSRVQTNRIKLTLFLAKKDMPVVCRDRIAKALKWPLKFYFNRLIQLPVNWWALEFDMNMLDIFKMALRKEFGFTYLKLEIRSVTLGMTPNFSEGILVELP